jgi:hypothetical protein
LVNPPPFLAFDPDSLFRFLQGLVNSLALQQIARLACGDQIIHAALAPLGVRVHVIDGQDQPAFEISESVQAAVVASESIAPEDLHGILAA